MERAIIGLKRFTGFIALSVLIACGSVKDVDGCRQASAEFRAAQKMLFQDPEKSPLLEEDLSTFQYVNYFAFNPDYCVTARVKRTPEARPFEMATSTDRKPMYVKYADLHFELNGDSLSLAAYRAFDPASVAGSDDYLFVPFNDLSNGDSTYGGGRYMDLIIQEGETMTLDFNSSYHPYCAYDYTYSCPIPPEENILDVAIEAGVRLGINGKTGESDH